MTNYTAVSFIILLSSEACLSASMAIYFPDIYQNLLAKLTKYGTIKAEMVYITCIASEGDKMSVRSSENLQNPFEEIAQNIEQYRFRLSYIVSLHMHPILHKRISVEDVMQELYIAAHKRVEHWEKADFVPPFIRLRTLALQVVTDLHRHHLGAQKRDAYKEISFHQTPQGMTSARSMTRWLIDSMTSPRSKLIRVDEQRIVREAICCLPESDQEILSLRHFEELSNKETAHVLGIEQKAASIRYVRALKKLHVKMMDLTEFGS